MDIIGSLFIIVGITFFVAGVIGVIRLPDALSRMHASGKIGTIGGSFMLIGVAFLIPEATWKAIVLLIFLVLSGPVTSHTIALAHHREK